MEQEQEWDANATANLLMASEQSVFKFSELPVQGVGHRRRKAPRQDPAERCLRPIQSAVYRSDSASPDAPQPLETCGPTDGSLAPPGFLGQSFPLPRA